MKFVLIKHGNYFTVYSNLQVTFVKAGQNIKAKQTIGAVGSADNKNGELDFQIWRGCCKKLNPEDWIISR
jgi:murein DD-endopeptidase MepM/ murein hydrolase activator NlpD